jgi:dihydrofolate reductase
VKEANHETDGWHIRDTGWRDAGPGGPEEDRSGGFEHGGWAVPFFDDMMMQAMTDWIRDMDGLFLGLRTYEIFAAHWPYDTSDDPIAAKLNSVRKHVVSRALDLVEWNNSTLITGDVVEGIERLKREPGNELQVHGSGEVIQTLLQHDLIDAFRLWIFPVLLGTGKRLFASGTVPARLTLVETRTSSTGIYHVTIVAVLVWGLVVARAARTSA